MSDAVSASAVPSGAALARVLSARSAASIALARDAQKRRTAARVARDAGVRTIPASDPHAGATPVPETWESMRRERDRMRPREETRVNVPVSDATVVASMMTGAPILAPTTSTVRESYAPAGYVIDPMTHDYAAPVVVPSPVTDHAPVPSDHWAASLTVAEYVEHTRAQRDRWSAPTPFVGRCSACGARHIQGEPHADPLT